MTFSSKKTFMSHIRILLQINIDKFAASN